MRLLRCRSSEAAEAAVAHHLAAALRRTPSMVLGLATGRTMEGVYRRLVEMHVTGDLSFAAAASFNLDEYLGLSPDDLHSFAAFMRQRLFDRVDIDRRRTHIPDGSAADPAAEARAYEAAIRAAGGIDLQLLGIGVNGHIGFNEPGSPARSRTRVVELSAATREANDALFPPDVATPRFAITMGIGTICEAREIVLLATGEAKAEALRAAIEGPPDPAWPASLLAGHPALTIIADAAAAGLVGRRR